MRWVFVLLILGGVVCWQGCPNSSSPRLYRAKVRASSASVDGIKSLDYLGSKIMDGGVMFNVFSANATRVELLLFDDPDASSPSQVYSMSRLGDVWSVFVEGIGRGQFYCYRAWGPNWVYDSAWRPGSLLGFIADVDSEGHRFNPNKGLMDPYGRAFHRDHDWSLGSAGSGPYRAESSLAACAKAIVVREGEYVWSQGEQAYWEAKKAGTLSGHGWEDLIIYEVHLKGFTANLQGEVKYPGTYRGFGEMAPYLKELGVTAVELLPIHEANEETYWGYMTIGFFAPEVKYAYNPKLASQIADFKWMVEQLHKNGIEVILDVVFNHTGEGGLWRQRIPDGNYTDPDDIFDPAKSWVYDPVELATLYNFRALDNVNYYGLGDGKGGGNRQEYWESTGVGNMMRCNNLPGKRLILDSLRYWVEEMHVDGFRFDLANTLGRDDSNHANWSPFTLLKEIVNDPVLQAHNTRIIAEPWDAQGGSTYHLGEFPKADNYATSRMAWYEWNDKFRNAMRTFINTDDWKLNSKFNASDPNEPDLGGLLTGSAILFYNTDVWGVDGRAPYHSINFITAHDGFTMHDLLSYADKRNGKGPLNPEGEDPLSGDDNNHSRNWPNLEEKRQMHRNLAVLLFLSHGTPMMLGGDEWMRTKYGNNNSYTRGADNPYNWFRWYEWKNVSVSGQMDANSRWRMFDFYKKLIQFRKRRKDVFAPTDFDSTGRSWFLVWKKPDGTDADASTWSGESIGIYYPNTAPNKRVYIAINMEEVDTEFTLPGTGNWEVRIDTQLFFDKDASTTRVTSNFGEPGKPVGGAVVAGGGKYTLKARTIVVFEEE
ncbi:MAG: glycosyl hydrolase [Planctomycetota bacterium]|nr:MAG: glycosyl hydrolase [Planctomycetota bacterium]